MTAPILARLRELAEASTPVHMSGIAYPIRPDLVYGEDPAGRRSTALWSDRTPEQMQAGHQSGTMLAQRIRLADGKFFERARPAVLALLAVAEAADRYIGAKHATVAALFALEGAHPEVPEDLEAAYETVRAEEEDAGRALLAAVADLRALDENGRGACG